jgi:membrane fusion protein (multidrug efflux system)
MGDVFSTAGPRLSLQGAEPEGVVEDLRLIEPRSVRWRPSGTPPAPAHGDLAPAVVQDQQDTPESMMLAPESLQRRDEVRGMVGLQNGRHHPPGVDHQEGRAGNQASLQHLLVGHLIEAHSPDGSLGQPPGVGVALPDLLGPVLQPPIQPGDPPGEGPMRLEIDPVEERLDGAGQDDRYKRGTRPAENRPGAARPMSLIVLVVRRLVITLMLAVALASGGVVGLSKMGIDVLPPQHMRKVNAAADYIGTNAKQAKEWIVRKYESSFHKQEEETHHEQRKIVVTSPMVDDVTITQSYVCQIRGQRHIDVRALDSGLLDDILVKEGQAVKKGDVMFGLRPILYKTRYDAENAEALFALRKLNNTRNLFEKHVVSENEVRLAEAEYQKAEAKANQAKAELGFTEVAAPFDGIVDRLLKREGSLIKEEEVLTTLSDNSVMWVYFNVPEKDYLEYMANREQHEKEDKIELVLANGDTFPQAAAKIVIEADFNNENGNIKFRADFPNPVVDVKTGNRLLRHGQTGTIKIRRPFKNALLIPQRATFELLDKRYVKVVGEDDKAKQTLIKTKHELEDIFVIDSGLSVSDKIILEGARDIEEGEKVEYEFRKPEEALDRNNQKFHAE